MSDPIATYRRPNSKEGAILSLFPCESIPSMVVYVKHYKGTTTRAIVDPKNPSFINELKLFWEPLTSR